MQPNKNIKIFINYFLGPILFAWLAYSIYRQIRNQPQLEASWRQILTAFDSYKIIYLLVAILLMPLNWSIEAVKWKLSVQGVQPVSFFKSLRAVLAGVSFSVTMPNRVGEYLGRMLYLPEGSRLKAISVTLVSSFAQLLVTLMAGTVALLALKNTLLQHFPDLRIWSRFILSGLLMIDLLALLIYFNVAGEAAWIKKWIGRERYGYLLEAVKLFDLSLLIQLVLLSLLRYAVFITQYILLFYFFEVNIDIPTILAVMAIVFLAMALIPSIALVEVWLRGEILIVLMGIFSSNTLGIGFVSVTIWFFNLILPAIMGSLLLLNLRIFRKKSE
ncbi:MAG: lysylphosphatidylglycerol synthase domain-containing protein [Flavisolibacter sp.]